MCRAIRTPAALITALVTGGLVPPRPVAAQHAPAPRVFDRYASPGTCVAAVLNARDVLGRSRAAQRAAEALDADPSEGDTLPAGVVAVARACAARFTAGSAPPAELADLFDLYVLGNNDSAAAVVAERRLALVTTDTARRRVLRDLMLTYLGALPARVDAAEALVARITTGGTPALGAQVDARGFILAVLAQRGDWDRSAPVAKRLIAAARALPPDSAAAHERALMSTYRALLATVWLDSAGMAAIGRQAQADLARAESGRPASESHWAKGPLEELIRTSLSPLARYDGQGAALQAVPGEYWFPAGAAPPRPASGHVSLIMNLGYGGCVNDPFTFVFSPEPCLLAYDRIRRLHERYAARGLDITLVVQTSGHPFFNPETDPAAEARAIAKYLLDDLKLPVTLAVRATPVAALPAPDGRRDVQMAKLAPLPAMQLVDRAGRVQYVARSPDEWARIPEWILRRVLSVSTPPTGGDGTSAAGTGAGAGRTVGDPTP